MKLFNYKYLLAALAWTLMSGLLLPINAKSVKELWISMPDSIIPYLSTGQRTEMVNADGLRMKEDNKNLLGGNSHIDTLTASFLSATLSPSSSLQIKLLPSTVDSIVCLVLTYSGPQKESEVYLYSQNWEYIRKIDFSTLKAERFMHRPDSMAIDRYNKLLGTIEPFMVSASFAEGSEQLLLQMSTPLLTSEERKDISQVIKPLSLRWNGQKFE